MDEFEVFDVKPFVSRLLGLHQSIVVSKSLPLIRFVLLIFAQVEFFLIAISKSTTYLSGMGDWSGFMDKIHEVVPMDQQPELLQKLSEGNFTLRIMYEQFQNILKMGPIGQVLILLNL